MKRTTRCLLAFAPILAVAAPRAMAQTAAPAGPAAMVVTVQPVPGHGTAFEEGVRRHMANTLRMGDTRTWVTFEVIAGERTGQYLVGTFNHAWADFDEPPPFDVSAMQESMEENIVPHVEDVQIQYSERVEDLSRWSPGDPIAPMYELIRFKVRMGQMPAFQHFLAQVGAAMDAGGDPSYSVFRPVIGGEGPEVTISVPHQGFADWTDGNPNWLEEMLVQAYGHAGGAMLMETMNASVESVSSNLIVLRTDLSQNLPSN